MDVPMLPFILHVDEVKSNGWSERESRLLVELVRQIGGCSSCDNFDWESVASYFHGKKPPHECRSWYIKLVQWTTAIEQHENDQSQSAAENSATGESCEEDTHVEYALENGEIVEHHNPNNAKRKASGGEREHRARKRRKALDITRKYKCPVESCPRAYGTDCALKYHIKKKHPEFPLESLKWKQSQLKAEESLCHLDVISSAGIVPQTSEPSLPDENGGILPATLAAPSFNLDQPSGSNSLIGIPTAPGISHTSVDSGSVFSFGSATLWDRASNLVSSMVKGQQNSSAVYSGS